MQLALSWDLLIIVFFVVIMSYSYIVGQNGTIKIILSSYIAMLSANGLGNLLARYIELGRPLIKVFETTGAENVVIFKIFIFVILILALVLRGGFVVDMNQHSSWFVRTILVTVFGFLTAGLIMSTILAFIASSGGELFSLVHATEIPTTTLFVRSLIDYSNAWFAAPAIGFVVLSFLSSMGPSGETVEQ